ncbi:MAG: glycosyltransferase family 10 [Verrucomicrobiota bacterium]
MTKARKPIRIDFCDYAPGYPKTDNFFYNLLKTRFDIQVTDQPEFLIYATPGSHLHRVHNCVKIYFGIESFMPDWNVCDYAMTCHYLDDPRHLRLPYYALYGTTKPLDKQHDDPEAILKAKTRFCGFVVSNAGKRKTQKRVDFFHRLSRYKRVDSAGRAFNNIGAPLPDGPRGKIDFLQTCKFNIAFENASLPGYTTEKLVEAMWARTVPIYWGSPRVHEEFNRASFLNYLDFADEEALIERIIELDKDDAKYLEVMRQPYCINNKPNEYFNLDRVLDFFERIFTTPIRPVSQRRRLFSFGRWVLVKRNKPHGP